MFSRIASLSSLALAAVLFTSCGGGSGLAILPKSKIRGMQDEKRNFTLPGPSQDLVSAARSKPRDKLMAGSITAYFHEDYGRAGSITTLVFGLGMIVILFAPDTTKKKLSD